jgi:hypothetical protein
MGQLLRGLFAFALLTASCASLSYSQSTQASSGNKPARVVAQHTAHPNGELVEEFSFLIKDFKVDHQSELNTLNISISYRYVVNIPNTDYPDFRLLAKDVETLLTNYPNEVDYWEIVNKNLTSVLMKKYPAISRLTSEITADPTRLDPYVRSSRVTRERPARVMRKRS